MDKKVINVDASSLRSAGCMLNFYRVVVEGYREKVMGNDMVYGIAVHKFIDTMFKTKGDLAKARDACRDAFTKIPKYTKTKKEFMDDFGHMLSSSMDIWTTYILNDKSYEVVQFANGEPATEMTFRIPFYEDEFVLINLAGTIDRLGKIRGGCYAVGDYKTTGAWNPQEYLDDYSLSHQLRFYVLALKLMARKYPDSVLGQIGSTRVGAFIDGLFIKAKITENKYIRSQVYQFSDKDLEEFENSIMGFCKVLAWYIQVDVVPTRLGIVMNTCRQQWGKCKFWGPCSSGNEQIAQLMLKRDFAQRPYDPLNFGNEEQTTK